MVLRPVQGHPRTQGGSMNDPRVLWLLDQARIDPPEPKPEPDDYWCEDCPGGRMCCCAHDDREDQ